MERIFIEAVKNHPCLWKKDIEDYKINRLKDEAWRKVIAESEVSENGINTVKEARYFWKKLRDGHRQSLSRQLRMAGTKKWKYQKDIMEFILPYLKQTNESAISAADSDFSKDDNDIDIDINDDASSCTSLKPPKTENIFVSECTIEEHDTEQAFRDRQVVDTPKSPRPALRSFFASMCDMTSALPEYIQIRVERKIFDVVMEAREEHLKNQSYFGS